MNRQALGRSTVSRQELGRGTFYKHVMALDRGTVSRQGRGTMIRHALGRGTVPMHVMALGRGTVAKHSTRPRCRALASTRPRHHV